MKILGGILIALIILIQWPLWFGKGGWLRVWEVDRQLRVQQEKNEQLRRRNDGLAADVQDLKQGGDAIEERARYELGMVRPDEVFFQYSGSGDAAAGKASAAPAGTQGKDAPPVPRGTGGIAAPAGASPH